MWLFCIPPLVGWIVVAWLVFTHEKVTCFNYHRVINWFNIHGEHLDHHHDHVHEFDESSDLTQSQRDDRKAKIAAGLKKTIAAAKAAKDMSIRMAAAVADNKWLAFCGSCCAARSEDAAAVAAPPPSSVAPSEPTAPPSAGKSKVVCIDAGKPAVRFLGSLLAIVAFQVSYPEDRAPSSTQIEMRLKKRSTEDVKRV